MSGTVVVMALQAVGHARRLSAARIDFARSWQVRRPGTRGARDADLRTRRQAPEFPADGRYWVAETAVLIGRVRLKSDASVWFGAVLRGDNEWIELGERSQIQDNATLHTDPGFPMMIGANCVIGHKVMLHGCTIGDNSLIGMGAIMLNGVEDRQQLPGRRRRAGHRGQELSRQFADRRLARARRSARSTTRPIAMIARGADIYVRRWQQYAKGLKRIG